MRLLQFAMILAAVFLWSPAQAMEISPDDMLEGRFDNGIRFVIRRVDAPAKVATIRIVVAAGTAHETRVEAGLAHYLEHVIATQQNADGSRLFVVGDNSAARFGLAYTGLTETAYDLHFREQALAGLPQAVGSLLRMIVYPNFDQATTDRERQAIIQEQFSGGADRREYDDALLRFMSGGSINELATVLSVTRSATPDMLRAFHARTYHSDRIAIIVVGDVDVQSTYRAIRDLANQIPASVGSGEALAIVGQANRGDSPQVAMLVQPESSQPSAMLARLFWPDGAPRPIDSRSDAIIRLVEPLLNEWGRNWVSRARAPSLTMSVTFASSPLRSIPVIQISAVNRNGKGGDTVAEAQAFAGLIAREGLTDEEIAEAKRQYHANAALPEADMYHRAHMPIVEALDDALGARAGAGRTDNIGAIVDGLTRKEINDALASWFGRRPDYVIYSSASGNAVEPSLKAAIEHVLAKPVKPVSSAVVRPAQSIMRARRPGNNRPCPQQEQASGSLHYWELPCANIKLVVQARPSADKRIRFMVTRPIPMAATADERFRDRLAIYALYRYGEWAGMDRFARGRFLSRENIELELMISPDRSSFQFWASAAPGKEALVTKLMGEALYDARLGAAEFADMKIDRLVDLLRAEDAISTFAAPSNANKIGDESLTAADLERRFRAITDGGRGTAWAVAGAADPRVIVGEISSWSFGKESPTLHAILLKPSVPAPREVRSGQGAAANVVIKLLLPAVFDQGMESVRTAAMTLLQTRLMDRLRTREHGVYFMDTKVEYLASVASDAIILSFQTKTEDETRLIAAAKDELAKFAATPLSDAELDAIKLAVQDRWWLDAPVWLSRNVPAVAYAVPFENSPSRVALCRREMSRAMWFG
jgi:predicted Zn-dependent peptidase